MKAQQNNEEKCVDQQSSNINNILCIIGDCQLPWKDKMRYDSKLVLYVQKKLTFKQLFCNISAILVLPLIIVLYTNKNSKINCVG